ncbi:MAG TPA: ATP-binding protein [Blastocatellia bacterium]|nr:ATP-binding protein [Blastocatellia bacterium]
MSATDRSDLGSFYQRHYFKVGLTLVAIIVLGSVLLEVRDLLQAERDVEQIYNGSIGGLDLIGDLQYETQEARRLVQYALTTQDTNLQVEYVDQARNQDKVIQNNLDNQRATAVSQQHLQARTRFEKDWKAYLEVRDDVIDSILTGSIKEATRRDLHDGVPAFDKVRKDLEEIKNLYKQDAGRQVLMVQGSFNRSIRNLIIFLLVTVVLAGFVLRMVQKTQILQALRRSEARLHEVIESINEGMFVLDPERKIELWNRAAERSSGKSREDVIDRRLFEVFPELKNSDTGAQVSTGLRGGQSGILTDLQLFGANSDRFFEARLFPFGGGTTVFFNDITERKQAAERQAKLLRDLEATNKELNQTLGQLKQTQDQLITQQKLASLGALTAGIAHEIKNPLNFVNNFAALSDELADDLQKEFDKQKDKMDSDSAEYIGEMLGDLRQNAKKIYEHGTRADSIVRGMLLHSRGRTGEHQPTDINALLAEYTNLAYHGLRARDSSFNVTINSNYDDSVGQISVVPQDLSRVFLNILNNACYAANEKRKNAPASFSPTLSVQTKNLGDKIEVRIRDNGDGIPSEIKDKIFNPFFTTKPTGEGTGLGLSISFEIVVQEHQGELKVETEPGQFTEFIVVLPKNPTVAKGVHQ